jgi:hypothetical protein
MEQNSTVSVSRFSTHHPNVFTPILSISEGRAGIAWVPSPRCFVFTSTLILSFLTLSAATEVNSAGHTVTK